VIGRWFLVAGVYPFTRRRSIVTEPSVYMSPHCGAGMIAGRLKYISEVEGNGLQDRIDQLGKSLNTLINSFNVLAA
jgi:hypothetical protein